MTKAERTRKAILDQAFELIYQNGYQATSIDKIIDTTAVTKGAFYYHFKNKEEMGIAMIKEIIAPRIAQTLLHPLQKWENPIEAIYESIAQKLHNDLDINVEFGCPTNNLVQEMGPLNLRFHQTLRGVLDHWIKTIETKIELGKAAGFIRAEVNAHDVAAYVVLSYEGLKSTGKIYGRSLYESYLKQLRSYLESLS